MENIKFDQGEQEAPVESRLSFDKLEIELFAKGLKNNEFGIKDKPLFEHKVNGNLSPKDEIRFNTARNAWWQKKFGFSYFREDLRKNLLATMEKFPGNEKAFEVFGRLTIFFEDTKKLNALIEQNERMWTKEMRDIVVEITKFRAQIGDFIEGNARDEKLCADFWENVEMLARGLESVDQVSSLRKSTLSQVAVTLAFKEIGHKPIDVAPGLDAFKMIDIKVDDNKVVQVKSSNEIQILKSNEVASVGIGLKETGKTKIFHVDGERFRANIKQYESWINQGKKANEKQQIEGWVITIPPREYDRNTGKPSAKFVAVLQNEFGKK
jgi:hypothetical protein